MLTEVFAPDCMKIKELDILKIQNNVLVAKKTLNCPHLTGSYRNLSGRTVSSFGGCASKSNNSVFRRFQNKVLRNIIDAP